MIQHMRSWELPTATGEYQGFGKRAHPVEALHGTIPPTPASTPAYPQVPEPSQPPHFWEPNHAQSPQPTVRLLLLEGVKAVVLEVTG